MSELNEVGWWRCRSCLSALLLFAVVLGLAPEASATSVAWTAPNAHVTVGNAPEYENPLSGNEYVEGFHVIEWRDADYLGPGSYDDWVNSGSGTPDGNAAEVWLRNAGMALSTTTTIQGEIIGVHLSADQGDGIADVLVDGFLVAQLDMGVGPVYGAFILVENLPNGLHTVEVIDQGQGQTGDDVAIKGASVLEAKWHQPPDPTSVENVFWGWDEYSVWDQETEGPSQVVADDWVCENPDPITDIHWWGSYIGLVGGDLTGVQRPDHFHITIWTDVPDPDPLDPATFSHPGTVVWEIIRPIDTITENFVGWDFDPRTQEYEATFKYDLILDPSEYFYQEAGGNIYWISIAACYEPTPIQEIPNPWGWKTRPRDPQSLAPDAAVRVFQPWWPVLGSTWQNGEPIKWPETVDHPFGYWDMAFELTARSLQPTFKWDQMPDLLETGIDVNATEPFLLANDFPCTVTGPLTDIWVYGSWLNDILPFGDPNNVAFTLSLHADIPVGPGGYSIPGDLLWIRDFFPGDFTVDPFATGLQEGWMDPPDMWFFPADSVCWLYHFPIPDGEFWQMGTATEPVIYWLDVKAFPQDPAALFGWKTTQPLDVWNDDSVWNMGPDPPVDPWQELFYPPGHPFAGVSLDLAFAIDGLGFGDVYVKWSQPPEPYSPDDGYNGWNEMSWYEGPQIAADDWVCDSPNPVTDVHWWGSFIGWPHRDPPASDLPQAFHIGIWTDVPPGVDPFSHPGQMLWEYVCTDYTWEFVGWDWDPRDSLAHPEACYYFECDIPQSEWFVQEEGCNIYWTSISAVYPLVEINWPWGWKTRPRDPDSFAPDDAVRIFDPTAPVPGMMWFNGMPIFWPTEQDSWDLAFIMTTGPVEEPEACCLPDGSCIMALPSACPGTPQGPGTFCFLPEACCLPDGTCVDVDPLCCDDLGGIAQGPGTVCQVEACCLPPGSPLGFLECLDTDPACCINVGGTPQGAASACTGLDGDGDGRDDLCDTGIPCTPPCDPVCNDGDVCTCDLCPSATLTCSNTPKAYGDADCNGVLNLFDIFCVLDAIGGVFNCCFSNMDLDPCGGNGVLNLFDIFAILDAIGGIDPCCSPGACCMPDSTCVDVAQGRDCIGLGGVFMGKGTSCATTTCPAPPPPSAARSGDREIGRSIERSSAPVQIKIVPSSPSAQPGGVVEFEVFATGATAVRGYDFRAVVSGLRSGSVELLASIADRRDNVLNGVDSLWTVNEDDDRIVAFATAEAGTADRTVYLGTFTALVSDDAAGTLRIDLATGRECLVVGDADGKAYAVDVTPGTVRISVPDTER